MTPQTLAYDVYLVVAVDREEWYYRLNTPLPKKYNNIKFGAYTTK